MRPLPNRSLQRNSKTKRNTDITGKDTNKRKHGGEVQDRVDTQQNESERERKCGTVGRYMVDQE